MHAKIGIAALLLAMAPLNGAVAQSEYPDKPIRVVTNAAGTLPDVVIRILGPALGEALGKPLIIENVAGVGEALRLSVQRAPLPMATRSW